MSIAALRSQLAQIVAPPSVAPDLLPTGVAGLDAALGGGLPRGRLTEIAGPLGSGTATLARRLVTGLVARGLGVAYVDATRTLDPADWAHLAAGHLRVVRPPEAARGAWCADVLLRSGAFVLVVLDGAPALTRQQALRLIGLAREKDAAFVVLGQDRPSAVSGAVRLAVRRRWGGAIQVLIERGGNRELVELPSALDEPRRLGVHAAGPDRRGTGRGRSKRWKGARNGGRGVPAVRGASAASDSP
ncbi:MAG: ATPase domain-containing protein [Gemmatimonadales bacterium]